MATANDLPRPRSTNNHSLSFMSALLAPCQAMSIALYELPYLAKSYPILHMRTCGQIRRENLLLLLQKYGSLANLNEKLELPRTDATLSQIKNQSITSRGNPKMMGDLLARKIERALELAEGWMDNDQTPPSYRQQRIEHAIKAMEHMPDYQLDQAIKIIDTLAEPASTERNGTHN